MAKTIGEARRLGATSQDFAKDEASGALNIFYWDRCTISLSLSLSHILSMVNLFRVLDVRKVRRTFSFPFSDKGENKRWGRWDGAKP